MLRTTRSAVTLGLPRCISTIGVAPGVTTPLYALYAPHTPYPPLSLFLSPAALFPCISLS